MRGATIPGALLAGLLLGQGGSTGEPGSITQNDNQKTDLSIGMPTLGGRLFWGDVVHFRGWRIQENVFTGHFRLLDPDDNRFASGSREKCQKALEQIKRTRKLAPLVGRAVICVHGMGRSSHCWSNIAAPLKEQGAMIVGFDYPSTECSITKSAEYLHQVIESLDGITEIDFVCHSMGGLVIRAYLDKYHDERIDRMVMLAVPNLGAEMADFVDDWYLYEWITGPGGGQLGTDPEGLIADLPTPKFEFAIIAGARGTSGGYNPLIPGDDDGTVTVASTRLPGATDFLQVNGVLHSFIMSNPRVVEATIRFLNTGHLREDGERKPIEASENR